MIVFLLLVSIMPFSRHPLWHRYAGELTLIKYVGGACLLYALARSAGRRSVPRLFQTPQARFFMIFVILVSISYWLRGPAFSWESNAIIIYASFFLLFLITQMVVDSLNSLRWVLLGAVGSLGWASIYVLREYQKYHGLYADFRPRWAVGDPNYFTISALLTLPLALHMLDSKSRCQRLFCLCCLAVILGAVMVAASRGGFLGLLASFAYVGWRSKRWRLALVVGLTLVLALSVAAGASPLLRLLGASESDDIAVEQRYNCWTGGLRMIEGAPVLGIGPGNFKRALSRYLGAGAEGRVAHNTYIEIAAECGIPALVAFVGMLVSTCLSLERTRRRTSVTGPQLVCQAALGIQAGLIGCALSVMFVSGQYQKLLWLMVFLSMSLPRVASRADRRVLEATCRPPHSLGA